MPENRRRGERYSRRDFARLALVSLPSVESAPGRGPRFRAAGEAQFGLGRGAVRHLRAVPLGPEASDLDGALKALVNFGVSQTELSNAVVERALGAPQPAGRGGGGGGGRGTQTPEQQAAARAAAEQLSAWRTSIPIEPVQGRPADVRCRRRHRLRLPVDTFVQTCRTQSTTTPSTPRRRSAPPGSRWSCRRTRRCPRRIGDFASKHQVNVGYHLRTTATITAWDEAMAQSPRNGLQLDIGHYVAGTGLSPVPLIEKHHARIFSMHLKDRKRAGRDQSEDLPCGERGHADQGRAAGAEEDQVGDSRRHRVRTPCRPARPRTPRSPSA